MLERVQGRADELRRRRLMVAAGAPIPVLVLIALLVALTLSPAGRGANVRTGPADEKNSGDNVRTDPNKAGVLPPGGQAPSSPTGGARTTPSPDGGDQPTTGAGPVPTTLPDTILPAKPRGGRVAFIRDGVVMSMKTDGSDVRTISRPGGTAASLDWSPDGTRLVLEVRDATARADIVVVDDDGGNSRIVAQTAAAPRWSPDGAWISFTRQVTDANPGASGWGVFVVRPDGSGQRRVLADAQQHAWAPDSRRLVYQCHSPRETCVGAVDGSSETVLQVGSGDSLAWSADGTRIAMYQTGRIVTFTPEGEDARVIHPEYTGRGLSWSPDGQWLASRAYVASSCPAGDCGTSGVMLLRASGTEAVRRTSNPDDSAPVFERT